MTLTLNPTLVMQASAQKFFLPLLSKLDRSNEKDKARFQHLAMVVSELHLLIGATFVCFILALGQPLVKFLLGPKFEDLLSIFALMAVLQCLRVLKGGSSTIALSDGRTENAMIANIARVSLLPAAYFAAVQTGSIEYIIVVAIMGEASGFIISLLLLTSRSRVDIRPLILPSSGIFVLCAIAIFISNMSSPGNILTAPPLLLVLIFATTKNLHTYVFKKDA